MYIKDKVVNVLVPHEDQPNRLSEHYEEFASDTTGHNLNGILNNSYSPQESINQLINLYTNR